MSKHLVLHDQSSDYSNVEDYVIIGGFFIEKYPCDLKRSASKLPKPQMLDYQIQRNTRNLP